MTVAEKPAVRGTMTEAKFMRLPKDGRKWEIVGGQNSNMTAEQQYAFVITLFAGVRPSPAVSGRD